MKEKKARARRQQRIPAFGEWNYAYGGDGDDWPDVTHYFESGMVHAGGRRRLVMAIPIPPSPTKPANKWKGSATPTLLELDEDGDDEKKKEKEKQQQHVVVGLGDHGDGGAVKKQQQRPMVAHAAYKASSRAAAVKAIDQDLYHIPPDMLCHEPRKRLTRRSLWMGCLGLNCVA